MLPFIKSTYFENLLDSFSNGVILLNTAGRVYAANSAAASILGIPREAILAMEGDELLEGAAFPDGLQRFLERAEAAEDGSYSASIPLTMARPDGSLVHLTLNRSLLFDYNKVFGIIVELSDVSGIVLAHEREKRALDDRRRIAKLRAAGLQQLSMAVAHQIRNPLVSIGGMARMLLRRSAPASHDRELLTAILESADRLEAIVRAVGAFAEIRRGETVAVAVAEMVDAARTETAARLPHLYDAVRWEVGFTQEELRADPDLVRLALREVFLNALEAIATGHEGRIAINADGGSETGTIGTVRLEFDAADGTLMLRVEDDGPGVPEVIRPYLFDPFFTTKAVGVGMGLCMAQRAVREHGGHIEISPRPGGGARVDLHFPKTPEGHPNGEEDGETENDG